MNVEAETVLFQAVADEAGRRRVLVAVVVVNHPDVAMATVLAGRQRTADGNGWGSRQSLDGALSITSGRSRTATAIFLQRSCANAGTV